MWSIGFSNYHGEYGSFDPSLLPSSIQLLRCTAKAVPGPCLGPASESAGRWALCERTDQRSAEGSATRGDACRGVFDWMVGCQRAEARHEVVETRRLELLTLSLQRRCSAG